MRIAKFLATGAIGLVVNLGTYHFLSKAGAPYLLGSIGAFAVAMVVGFILQKYWTFADRSTTRAHTQFAAYGAVTLCNLAINTLVVYLLVEYAHTHPLLAQTVGAGLVAFTSYTVYRRLFATTLEV